MENLLSGLLLILRQPFRSGDQITVGEVSGTVEAITIRETRLKTFDGQLVLIPNRDVYKSVITVRTHFPSRRMSFVVGIAYENDTHEACRVIQGALTGGLPRLEDTPEPEAVVTQLGVSTVDIEARFWCGPEQHDVVLAMDAAIRAVKRRPGRRGHRDARRHHRPAGDTEPASRDLGRGRGDAWGRCRPLDARPWRVMPSGDGRTVPLRGDVVRFPGFQATRRGRSATPVPLDIAVARRRHESSATGYGSGSQPTEPC